MIAHDSSERKKTFFFRRVEEEKDRTLVNCELV